MGIFPDYDQGYGSLRLSSVLWFGDQTSGFSLSTFDQESVSDGELWAVCLSSVDDSESLRVTLHWTDPQGERLFIAVCGDMCVCVWELRWCGTEVVQAVRY